MNDLLRTTLPALLLCAGAALPAAAAPKQKINPPPSAELRYAIKAKQKGIPVEGEAVTLWKFAGGKFVTTNQVRAALVGKILDTSSEGTVDGGGLAPAAFQEKRFRREPTTTTFDRGGKMIRFSESEQTLPLKGGEQDRSSALWQLISLARATPAKARAGSQWSFTVAGRRDADQWTFKAVGQEKISTGAGELNTLHIVRMPPADSKEQQLDIWLAPTLEWYPVRLRFADKNGDYIEQTLQNLNRKP
jgi:hypothetical protein